MAEKFFHNDFFKGWLVGDFNPAIFKSKDIEVAVKYYPSGFKEDAHLHKVSTEYTMIIYGSAKINDILLKTGEGMTIHPNEIAIFECITDCATLVIKTPSAPSDKYLV